MQFSLPKNTDISIHPIKSFTDNYIWMIKKNKDAVIVDPGDASPVLETYPVTDSKIVAVSGETTAKLAPPRSVF